MAPLTFPNTYNMVAFLTKSDASAGFDQVVDFLNAHVIQYALMVNPTIYVSCIKKFWATATIKKVNDAVELRALINKKKVVVSEDIIRKDLHLDDADGVECLPNKGFLQSFLCVSGKRIAWNEFSCSMASTVICLATVDDLTSHNTKYTSPALTQKVFANMRGVGKGFSGVKTPLFALMMAPPQPQAAEVEEEVKVPTTPIPSSLTPAPSPPPQDPTPTPHASPPLPPQEQPTTTSTSFMTLIYSLLETYATLSPKVGELEQDKHTQALEIIKLKKRVKKLEKKRRSKKMHPNKGKIEAIDADEEITLVDVGTQVDMDAELQGSIYQDVSAATKDVNAAEPTVFDDEEVTMTMAQTLIKMKAKKYDDKEENIDWNAVDEKIQEKHLDNIRKYQSLKNKLVSIAQARKNMIIYLKNMAGYKMEDFRGMTYDKVRPIFEREYKKFQTLFKPDKDVEEPQKKRVAEETLLQESFKKLKEVEVSGSEEDLVALWILVKEKFSSAVPNVDKEKALWVKLKRLFKPDADDVLWKLQRYMHYPITWKLHTNCGVHQVSSTTRRHDMFMLTEKDYPLSNAVMTLMLNAKLQVEKDSKMARDLVMKIFMEANKPKSRSLNTSSK
nr:hypothetical protein [Tanacetum cinerariifolium]